MNTSDLATNSTPQTTNSTTQPLPGTGLPTLPLPGTGVTAYNAITMQQYLFQQSLASQQILAQQQAVAHAVSIKAAAEQAAARAAEISKLLKGEKDDKPKEKSQESSPNRAISESKSSSKSPSSRSSKSKSVSPVRYRTSRTGREEHSSYRSRRHFGYYSCYDDHRDYFRPSYRRDTDRSGNRRGYLYPRRSRSRSRSRGRRRSPSRALLRRRYYHDDSRSPSRHRIRSPSPKPERRRSSRVANRLSMSKSPINGSSLSPSPQHARITSPRKLTARRSLSSSGNSLSRCTTSPLGKDNKLDRDVSSSENNDFSALDLRQQKKETRPLGKQLVRSESPNSSSRSRSRSRSKSTSTEYSGKKDTQEPRFKNAVSGKLASPDGNHSNSASSNGRSVRRASNASDDESSSGSADNRGFCQPSIKNGTVDNKHGEIGIVSGEQHKTFYDSVMERRVNQDHMKPLRVNRLSPSPNPLSDGGQRKYSDKRKKNIGSDKYVAREIQPTKFPTDRNLILNRHEHVLSPKEISRNKGFPAYSAYLEDEETSNRSKVEKDGGSHSEDAVVVEDAVNDRNCPKQGASNHDIDRFGRPNIPSECAIYPLPEAHQSMDGTLTHQKSLEKVNLERNYDVESPITLPDGAANVDTAQVSTIPNVCQYPEKKSEQGSRSRERRRKHSRKHHKRHRKEESEEDDDNNNESRKELKLRRHERKGRKRHHKSQKERKRRKRKHRDTSSSSADDLSASSEDGYKKDSYDVVSKRSTSSRKKRRHSPATLSSSSQ